MAASPMRADPPTPGPPVRQEPGHCDDYVTLVALSLWLLLHKAAAAATSITITRLHANSKKFWIFSNFGIFIHVCESKFYFWLPCCHYLPVPTYIWVLPTYI